MKELWYCSGRKQATSGKILTDFLIRNDSLPLNYTWKSKIKGSRKFHVLYSCVHAMLLQSCRTLCHPMYYSPPASPLQGILQTRIPEWVALPSSRGSSWPRDWTGVFYIGKQVLLFCFVLCFVLFSFVKYLFMLFLIFPLSCLSFDSQVP